MIFKPETLNEEIWVGGIGKKTSSETLYDDLPELSKHYAKIRPSIQNQVKPLTTCVASKDDRIFMGDFVTQRDVKLESFQLKKDQTVVKVSVPFHFQLGLPAKVARIRNAFYQSWLPESGYISSSLWQDMEVYHYRRRYFRKSRKLIMELWFLIEKRDDKNG